MINNCTATTPMPNQEKKRPAPDWQGRALIMLGAATLTLFIWEAALIIHEAVVERLYKQDPLHIEKMAKDNYPSSLIDRVKKFDKIDHHKVVKRLAISMEDEKKLFTYLLDNYELTDHQLQEIFQGAHVKLADGGEAYNTWSNLSKVRPGYSSHPSSETQYRMHGSLVKALVFSLMEENGVKSTWFQLESHPVSFGHVVRHMVDFVKYRLDGMNRGPDGISHHTHKKPIELQKKV